MSKKFIRYNDMENSYHTKTIAEIIQQGLNKSTYCVMCKIHGCNVQACITKDDILYGKRTAFLGKDASFFCFQDILPKYEEGYRKVYDIFKEGVKCGDEENFDEKDFQVTIYGEMFGGYYPNCEKSNQKMIQKEVLYCPKEEVLFFDIRVVYKDSTFFVDMPTLNLVLDNFGIPNLKPLFVGTFDECLNYDTNFLTKIPALFGLPDIEGNICEGIVIKPYEDDLYLRTGSRVILKKKNDKFSEEGFVGKEKKINVPKEVAENLVVIFNELEGYVNENRFNAVFSKDSWEKKDFGRFIQEFNDDVIKDAIKNDLISQDTCDKDIKEIKRYIGSLSLQMIRKNFFERV